MAGRKKLGISESDFSSLLAAVSATAKGRAFLDEYRRRAQPAETLSLLDSLERIESSIGSVRDQLQPERIASELQHVSMTLDIAIDGAESNLQGDETARRFALVDRARRDLAALAHGLAGEVAPNPDETDRG
jgi:hypothetical protein